MTDCDLIVVGGGPAGMSAAMNAASEGLNTKLIECATSFGGQAGTSTCIKNYAGFPGGISGGRLMSLMLQQAREFKVDLVAPLSIVAMRRDHDVIELVDEGETIHEARAAVLACGVQYKHLPADNLAAFLGEGVTYGSPSLATKLPHKSVAIVGGANSAGQAAIYLARNKTCHVQLLVRSESIEAGMSDYLVQQIYATPNIHIWTNTELQRVDGGNLLESATLNVGGDVVNVKVDRVFVMIGATPKLAWLNGLVERDDHGFVCGGTDMQAKTRNAFSNANRRMPLTHETSLPGVFVAGDVRSESIRRVASAVGDGASAISDVHKFLTM